MKLGQPRSSLRLLSTHSQSNEQSRSAQILDRNRSQMLAQTQNEQRPANQTGETIVIDQLHELLRPQCIAGTKNVQAPKRGNQLGDNVT